MLSILMVSISRKLVYMIVSQCAPLLMCDTHGSSEVRSAISIVPQSPDLFEGTIRENIDPTGAYQDADIWVALEHVHLKQYVDSLEGGLDAPVREGGSSLSAGQRQLLCFARALLRKSKILVLDEGQPVLVVAP